MYSSTISNHTSLINKIGYSVFVYVYNDCIYPQDKAPQIVINNSYFSEDQKFTGIMPSRPPFKVYTSLSDGPLEIKILNTKFENLIVPAYGVLSLEIGPLSDVLFKNLEIKDIDIKSGNLIQIYNSQNTTLQDVFIQNITTHQSVLAQFVAENLVMNNITIQDLNEISELNNAFEIEYRSRIEVKGFKVIDSQMRYSSAFFEILEKSTPGSVDISQLSFDNVYVIDSSTILDVLKATTLTLTDLTFRDISTSAEDYYRALIDLNVRQSSGNLILNISNLVMENSEKPLVYFENNGLKDTGLHQITLSNITVRDCNYSDTSSFIEIMNGEYPHSLELSMSQLTFDNISFPSQGYLISLSHQLSSEVQLSSMNVTNIWNGGILVQSADRQSDIVSTVQLYNLTATNISNTLGSFLQLESEAMMYIHNSNFIGMNSDADGSVIRVTDSSQATFYSSIFTNNTAVRGGVFYAQVQGHIVMHECSLTNNFAISSGVGKIEDNGFFELYNCEISNNVALYAATFDIFVTGHACIIDHSTITQNKVVSTIEAFEYFQNFYVPSSIQQIVSTYWEEFNDIKEHFALRVTQGIVTIRHTLFTHQADSSYAVYSLIRFEDSIATDMEINESMFLTRGSNVILSNISLTDISSEASHSIFSIFDSVLELKNLTFHDVNTVLLELIYSQGSIEGITAEYINKDHMLTITG